MKTYLVTLDKPKIVPEVCIWTGDIYKEKHDKTEVVISAYSVEKAKDKIFKHYGSDVSIRSVVEIK